MALTKPTGTILNVTTPTVQRLTAANGVYTTPSNVKWIRVRLVGGGGSGGDPLVGSGNTGGQTSFGAALLIATGGANGLAAATADGGLGGTVTVNSPAVDVASTIGGCGGGGSNAANSAGGVGGSSAFGGGGRGGGQAGSASAGAARSGAGGGGGGSEGAASSSGGGAGGYVEAVITSPSATYTYAVGSGGTAAGANSGAGGSGIIIVEEHYV